MGDITSEFLENNLPNIMLGDDTNFDNNLLNGGKYDTSN